MICSIDGLDGWADASRTRLARVAISLGISLLCAAGIGQRATFAADDAETKSAPRARASRPLPPSTTHTTESATHTTQSEDHSTGSSTHSKGSAAHSAGSAAHSTGSAAHATGSVAHSTGSATHSTGSATHTTGPVAHSTASSSHVTGSAKSHSATHAHTAGGAHHNSATFVPSTVTKDGKPIWLDIKAGQAASKAKKRLVIADFYTEWCGWCKVMDSSTLKNPAVESYLAKNFICMRVNPEEGGPGEDLARTLGINGYPTYVVFNSKGEAIDQIVGFKEAPQFLKLLQEVVAANTPGAKTASQ